MKFTFSGRALDGRIINGLVTAKDEKDAVRLLQSKELEVLTLLPETKKGLNIDVGEFLKLDSLFEFVSMKDVVDFSKQMSALLDAGVSLIKALQLIAEDSKKGVLRNTFNIIIQDVKAGKSISQALAKHRNIFSDFYINLVKTGEESGKMSQSFAYLSEYLDRNYALVVKVRNAMIYPGFVIATFFVVMILIFTLVIPRLADILKESSVELPLLTQIVLSISDFLVAYGIYFGVFSIGAILYSVITLKKTAGWKDFFDTVKVRVPIIRNVFKMLYVTRIADNIQTLLSSGVSLTKAIQITGDVVGNKYYKQIMDQALLDVKAGVSISASFARNKDLVPTTLTQMLKIGEETGEIGKLMGNIAKFYQRELTTSIDTMVGLIEPMMIVILGLGVGLLLVSVLMPIYNLAGSF